MTSTFGYEWRGEKVQWLESKKYINFKCQWKRSISSKMKAMRHKAHSFTQKYLLRSKSAQLFGLYE